MEDDSLAAKTADDPLWEEMQALWREADREWDDCRHKLEYDGYVSADYVEVYRQLMELQNQATTFLEWGSGLGVTAIMASRLGFEAYGLEVEPLLVERARQLAEEFGDGVEFAQGSFIPDDYCWGVEEVGNPSRTNFDERAGYDELDMELRDFDLVYAYPWPDEHGLYLDIMRSCGNRRALFLTYDAREGVRLCRMDESNA